MKGKTCCKEFKFYFEDENVKIVGIYKLMVLVLVCLVAG